MQKNIKISIFIYSMSGGGAERVMSYLLPYLQAKNYDVILVLMNTKIVYPSIENIPIHYLEKSEANESGIFKLLKIPYLAWKYARFLKKENITHSFSLLTRPCYINIMARWFTNHPYKLMISERNYPSLQYGYDDSQSKINSYLVKKLYPKADLIISNAKASTQDLIDNFNVSPEKTGVIYNPIDLNKINAIAPKETFFDDKYINLVSVGRLQTVKNHQLMIEAIAPFDNTRLYIFGEGELREDLQAQIDNLGITDRVFLMGFESNPFQYLKTADIFLFSSNHEGFPNVVMEAMACGLPIITTNCKSGPDEIMKLKETKLDDIMITDYGVLSPVSNATLLQKGIAYCLENQEYLDNCRINVKQRIKDFEREPILELYTNHILA
ncbi:glycosyltransferase [Maribacter sp.]|uniref:glycosyltransferase n=1 Tax=Maribacter sp. TaxID=1897614 RepID=UPI003298005D